MRLIRTCVILFFAILVGSCENAPVGPPKLIAAVTHHHGFGSRTPAPGAGQANVGNGESVKFLTWGNGQANNLRHDDYQKLIAVKLQANGFRTGGGPNTKSRYLVRFRYWNSGKRVRTTQGSITTGSPGELVNIHGTLVWLPGNMVTIPTSRSVTTYVRNLVVEMFDTSNMAFRSSAKHKSPKKIFEGYVVSEGKNPSVHDVIKSLIDVMFKTFPVPSGQRRMVSVIFTR